MNLPRSARVCVIDDEPEECAELLLALNSMGVGAVHFHGDRAEALPATGEQFRNLRLVFLDMHLGTHVGMDARAVTAQTAKVFAQIVSPESGPILVVVWTKHPDYVSSFRGSLYQIHAEFRGRLFFARMDKPTTGSKLTAQELRGRIETQLTSLAPLPLLWRWDSLVQEATTSVAAELCRLACSHAQLTGAEGELEESDKMLNALSAVLFFLLKAGEGRALSEASAPSGLFNILGSLHAHRLENLPAQAGVGMFSPILTGSTDAKRPSAGVQVALNTMLMVGGHNDEEVRLRPGTIYHISDEATFESEMGISVRLIASELCQRELLKPERGVDFTTWVSNCRPVLLEVSPSCDFAQQKRPVSRLVAGLLVAADRSNLLKQRKEEGFSSLRVLNRVKMSGVCDETEWTPAFTSALVLSWPEKDPIPFLKPVARLKEPVIADFRSWLSHQSARPGYLSVE